jgi:hypothetical protein
MKGGSFGGTSGEELVPRISRKELTEILFKPRVTTMSD